MAERRVEEADFVLVVELNTGGVVVELNTGGVEVTYQALHDKIGALLRDWNCRKLGFELLPHLLWLCCFGFDVVHNLSIRVAPERWFTCDEHEDDDAKRPHI